eukprot:CAMPEP_0197289236 /NCGR_PEP_ID=MMETSP0890-20130614/6471_1 /TAXON_ID=44058 ORGANISM="Aureoumbra lagunensis, Strain CCMP1510" /NCGR_SAMPLE_ID=MMETSP0890 /ASSEMBLY_ACC=CAM_ASM_000533 /LENGTH=61 /DNA_ID=CAMNT_0042760509 /DNA_START=497 /DNA_END=682 /DNA_ORIENTATION=+
MSPIFMAESKVGKRVGTSDCCSVFNVDPEGSVGRVFKVAPREFKVDSDDGLLISKMIANER